MKRNAAASQSHRSTPDAAVVAAPAVHPEVAANDTAARPFAFASMPAPDEATLASLQVAFGAPDEACRALTLAPFDDAALVALGAEVDSDAILASVPTILVSAVAALASLDARSARYVMLDAALFAVVVDEAQRLAVLKRATDKELRRAGTAGRGSARVRRDVRREAIAERDVVADGVVRALGPGRADEVRTAAGNAVTDPALATGLDHLAEVIEAMLSGGADAERASLARYGVDAARVRALRDRAADVRAMVDGKGAVAPRNAHQRALDAQDGRVLVLLDKVASALRAARRATTAVPKLQYGRLAWYFDRRGRKGKSAGGVVDGTGGAATPA